MADRQEGSGTPRPKGSGGRRNGGIATATATGAAPRAAAARARRAVAVVGGSTGRPSAATRQRKGQGPVADSAHRAGLGEGRGGTGPGPRSGSTPAQRPATLGRRGGAAATVEPLPMLPEPRCAADLPGGGGGQPPPGHHVVRHVGRAPRAAARGAGAGGGLVIAGAVVFVVAGAAVMYGVWRLAPRWRCAGSVRSRSTNTTTPGSTT